MKIIFLFLLAFSSALPAAAQNACGTALPEAPPLLGLRLGMSPAEAQALFGRDLRLKVKTSGTRTFFQNYINKRAPGALAGVRALYLRFHKGRLYQTEIFFEGNEKFKTLADLTADFAAQNDFPADLWRFEHNRAAIDCGRFSIRADLILNPHVEVTDEETRIAVKAAPKK